MKIHIVDDPLVEKYEMIPRMLAERLSIRTDYVKQDELHLVPFEDRVWHFYFLNNDTTGHLLNPKTKIAKMWDNKIFQYEQFKNVMRVPKYEVFESSAQLLVKFSELKEKYGSFLITPQYGVNGNEFLYCDESTHMDEVIKKYYAWERLRVSKYIEGVKSISFHLIVAGPHDFYASPCVEQHIKNRTIYKGGKFPFEIDLQGYDRIINNVLAKTGYRGLAHVDLLVKGNKIYFGEINPRTAGSTPYICCSLEREYGINLPYLEYHAVTFEKLPEDILYNKYRFLEWDFEIMDGEAPGELRSPNQLRDLFKRSGIYFIDAFKEGKYIELMVQVKHDYTNKF